MSAITDDKMFWTHVVDTKGWHSTVLSSLAIEYIPSNFLVDKNGYIVTNNHVVEGGSKIKVKLHNDPTDYRARVIGTDLETDLAIIKIDPNHALEPVTFANSDGVQVGDWAVAIGSPFGLEASVTAGIVSAFGRNLPDSKQFQRFIQTDAAINPGNSGGPLLNIRGEVIGVNTQIATSSRGSEGVGFALPSNMVIRVYNDIIKDGHVTRGSIGVGLGGADAVTLKALGLNSGVNVTNIVPGGPADKGGVKAEDIIDYTRHDNVAERLAKRFGAAIGEGAVHALQRQPALR